MAKRIGGKAVSAGGVVCSSEQGVLSQSLNEQSPQGGEKVACCLQNVGEATTDSYKPWGESAGARPGHWEPSRGRQEPEVLTPDSLRKRNAASKTWGRLPPILMA